MDVVRMLNNMYIMFDEVSGKYDVYKVATIGDAYFVASGVPVRNGDRHAKEIANMALALLQGSRSFTIPHLPQTLQIRIGVHTGPCVAGVVGLKTPRYLLYGDTVSIASHMEQYGEPMNIHLSETSAALLMADFKVIERSTSNIDGYGNMKTFWLREA